MSKILELIEKRKETWNKATKFLEDSRDEDGIVSAEDTETYNKMVDLVDNLGKEVKRLEKQAEIDQMLSQPTRNILTSNPQRDEPVDKEGRASNEYKEAFWKSMRCKNSYSVQNALRIGEDTEGGYLTPEEFDKTLIEALEKVNVFRKISHIIETSGDRKINVVPTKGKAFWVGEGQEIPESDDRFGQISIGAHKMATMIKISDELLQDNVFNLEGYIRKEFARRMGKCEEEGFFIGSGKDMPLGILSDSGGADLGITSAKPEAITVDDIIDLFYSVEEEYRNAGTFLTNDSTIREIRKLKDATGRYIWEPSIKEGEPDRILNRPIRTSTFMPGLGEIGAKVMAFGDFEHYWIVDRQGRSFQRLNELYAVTGMVGFRTTQRVDGRLIRPDAVKVLQLGNETIVTTSTAATKAATKAAAKTTTAKS